MKALLVILIIILIPVLLISAEAEEREVYVICNPASYVCIRQKPKKADNISGSLECGDSFKTDGRVKNGYIHLLGLTEDGEGWVHTGYVVEDQPVICKTFATVAATGRVKACRFIDGQRKEWVPVGTDLTVYAISEEWAVTSKGFIRTRYLEVWDGE